VDEEFEEPLVEPLEAPPLDDPLPDDPLPAEPAPLELEPPCDEDEAP
jgi:hypothetical protein